MIDATKEMVAGIKLISTETKNLEQAFKEQKQQILSAVEHSHYALMLNAINEIRAQSTQAKLKKETIDHDDTILGLYEAIEQNNENVIASQEITRY